MEKASTIGFGVHLPVMLHPGETPTLKALCRYAEKAELLGFRAISVNDHLVYRAPWLDSLTVLAAICASTEKIQLATSILLLELRNPMVMAKALATLDHLSGGRLLIGVGGGSHEGDYQLCGIPFEERWKRLDEAVAVLKALWQPGEVSFAGRFHAFRGVAQEPLPLQKPHPPIWIGSWGSEAGLRRAARLGDGWMASAYNTDPTHFRDCWAKLQQYRREAGKEALPFGNAVVTTFMYLTEDPEEAKTVLQGFLSPVLGRSVAELQERFLIGSINRCAEKVRALAEAGAQRLHVWPVAQPMAQIERFAQEIMPQFVP